MVSVVSLRRPLHMLRHDGFVVCRCDRSVPQGPGGRVGACGIMERKVGTDGRTPPFIRLRPVDLERSHPGALHSVVALGNPTTPYYISN